MCHKIYQNVIAVTNRKLCKRPFMEQLDRICQCHPKAIILREKDLQEKEYAILAKDVIKLCKSYLCFIVFCIPISICCKSIKLLCDSYAFCIITKSIVMNYRILMS